MSPTRIQGLLFMALSVVSIADGWRITSDVRDGANFDPIGPDRYLMIVSATLLVIGLWLVVGVRPVAVGVPAKATPRVWPPSNFVLVLLTLSIFAFAIPWVGFLVACLGFFVIMFRLLSDWNWTVTLGAAVITSLAFYGGFIRLADLPMPKGVLGWGL